MTEYTPEETARHRDEWVAELRSGRYGQTTRVLKNEQGHCCLGVAGELCAKTGLVATWVDHDSWHFGTPGGNSSYTTLTPAMSRWLGLADDIGSLLEGVTYGSDDDGDPRHAYSLTELNDYAGYTFDQIADVIESGNLKLAEGH